jgi:hypothetical protein
MRFAALMLFAAMPFSMSPCFAAQIVNDSGGRIGTYVERFTDLRNSGERMVVDGQCLSACTLVLALVPRDHICVTPNATFGFHAAWSPNNAGEAAVNLEATRLLWNMYPQRIRSWIRRNGGLGQNMIYLRGRQLAGLYPACSPDFERGGFAEATRGPNARAGRSRQARRLLARVGPIVRSRHGAAVASSGSHIEPRD